MFETKSKSRTWGFRFFVTDAVVIGAFAFAAILLRRSGNALWWMVVMIAIHFFLFCNVVRIRRSFELLWAAVFVTNILMWLCLDRLNWFGVVAVQLPITTGLVAAEVRSPRYHGIFAATRPVVMGN